MDNQTVIDIIVKYSKDCIVRRFVKQHFQKSLLLAKYYNLPSANTMTILIDEHNMRIEEIENDIGKLLMPLFEGKDFGHNNSKKHSLTIEEIKDGYITLDKEEYVILLKPLQSKNTGLTYLPGILYKIGSGVLKEDLDNMTKENSHVISDELLNLIIKKKTAYGYLE